MNILRRVNYAAFCSKNFVQLFVYKLSSKNKFVKRLIFDVDTRKKYGMISNKRLNVENS